MDRSRKEGGLALLWNSKVEVQITSFSKHHIYVEAKDENGKQLRRTGVYGHLEMGQKKHHRRFYLAGLSSLPLLCFGSFNEILHPHEITGSKARDLNLISNFREALEDHNYLFTWGNEMYGPYFIKEHLDFCAMGVEVTNFIIV